MATEDRTLEHEIVKTCEEKGYYSVTKGKIRRTRDYDLIDVDQPVRNVWIFLNTGECLFEYNYNPLGHDLNSSVVSGFLSTIDNVLDEVWSDTFNVLFGYKHVWVYSYIGLPPRLSGLLKPRLACVMCIKSSTEGVDRSTLDELGIYMEKCGKILNTFFGKFLDEIILFSGDVTPFQDFLITCMKILRDIPDEDIQSRITSI